MDVYNCQNVSSIITDMPARRAIGCAMYDMTDVFLTIGTCANIYYCSGNIYYFGEFVVLFYEITI